jgi:hypothetical protein
MRTAIQLHELHVYALTTVLVEMMKGGAFKAHVGQKVTYRFLSYEWSYRYLSAANTSTQLPGETAVFYDAATMPAMVSTSSIS